jgi:hypothetical protein
LFPLTTYSLTVPTPAPLCLLLFFLFPWQT